MRLRGLKTISTIREIAKNRRFPEEILKVRLGKGYKAFERSNKIMKKFGNYEGDDYFGILFVGSAAAIYACNKGEVIERISVLPSTSRNFEIMLMTLEPAAEYKLHKNSLDKDELIEIVSKNPGVYRGNVSAFFRTTFAKRLYVIEGNRISLRRPLGEVYCY